MKTDIKTVFVRNDKDRNYNWVLPYQVTEIPVDQLDEYIAAGFTDVDEAERKYRKSLEEQDNGVSNDEDEQSDDIQARIQFLKDHGLKVQANRKEETIIARSNEAGYGADDEDEQSDDE